jgi:hypothetical protein
METPNTLEAEANAAIAAAPISELAPVPPGRPSVADMGAGYAALAEAVLGSTFEVVAPAWAVTDPEKSKLAKALGVAVALWFPGEIPEKWVALIVVAGAGFEIVAARRDPATGKLKPRFHEKPASPASGDAVNDV